MSEHENTKDTLSEEGVDQKVCLDKCCNPLADQFVCGVIDPNKKLFKGKGFNKKVVKKREVKTDSSSEENDPSVLIPSSNTSDSGTTEINNVPGSNNIEPPTINNGGKVNQSKIPVTQTEEPTVNQDENGTDKKKTVVENKTKMNEEVDKSQNINFKPACSDPKCKDKNCAIMSTAEVDSESICGNECCAQLEGRKSCTDANCSGCDGNHDSTVRNTFLGIAGVLILAIIGYLSFIKMKTRRGKTSKDAAVTEI